MLCSDDQAVVVAGLADDTFADIGSAFLATGQGRTGKVEAADSLLVPARAIVAYAVDWLEGRFGNRERDG